MNPSYDNGFGSFGSGGANPSSGVNGDAGSVGSGQTNMVFGSGVGAGGAASGGAVGATAAGGAISSGTGDVILASAPEKKSKKGLVIGLAIVVVLVLVGVGIVATRILGGGTNQSVNAKDLAKEYVQDFIYGPEEEAENDEAENKETDEEVDEESNNEEDETKNNEEEVETEAEVLDWNFREAKLFDYYAYSWLGENEDYYNSLNEKISELEKSIRNEEVNSTIMDHKDGLDFYNLARKAINTDYLAKEFTKNKGEDLLALINDKRSELSENTMFSIAYDYLKMYVEGEINKYEVLVGYGCINTEGVDDECVNNLDGAAFANLQANENVAINLDYQMGVVFAAMVDTLSVINEWAVGNDNA